jgi:hypothetical protein
MARYGTAALQKRHFPATTAVRIVVPEFAFCPEKDRKSIAQIGGKSPANSNGSFRGPRSVHEIQD